MKVENIGEIIAERKFTLVRPGQPAVEVRASLGKPQRIPNHTDYYCPYQITAPADTKLHGVCGVDAFQAIQLTMATIGIELEVLSKDSGGKIEWDAGTDGNLGFPAAE